MKKILIPIIIIVIIGVVLRLTLVRKQSGTTVDKIALTVEVSPAKKTDVKRTCSLIGTLVADKTVQIFPETMGRVTKLLVREGSYVNKGDRLIAMRNEMVGFEFEEAYVTAPINGTVAKVLVDIGATIAPQAPVIVLVDISKIKVNFNAPETDAQCFRLNTPIFITVDAVPNKKFTGYISEISPVVDPLTKTVGVKAIIEKAGSLKPGMTARVFINLGEKKDVIAISQDVLVDNSVFVVKSDSIVERRLVKLGFIGDDLVEILEGLDENELVVVLGQQRLAGGEKVNPIVR